jgi:hypothetical protein
VRIVSGDEAGEVINEALTIDGVAPIDFIHRDGIFEPKKAVNVPLQT